MNTYIKLIKNNEYNTSQWSGGTTTELYIYPEKAEYSKLNFLFRISTATVNIEESDFTRLVGIDRKIMLLDGDLTLEHEENKNINLYKFEEYSFKGYWKTKGYGKARDFNLMTSENCKGSIECIKINPNDNLTINLRNQINISNKLGCVVYCFEGSKLLIKGTEYKLEKGDLLVIMDIDYEWLEIDIINKSQDEANIILSKISLKLSV